MTELTNMMKRAAVDAVVAAKPCNLYLGTVVSTSPLSVKVSQKLTLTERFLIVPQHLTDYQTKMSFDNPEIKQVYTTWNMAETQESNLSKISFKQKDQHEITIYNALKIGESVMLLSAPGGQKYYVLDRVVKV